MTKPTGHIVERGVENAMLVLLPWLPAYRYRVIHSAFSDVVTALTVVFAAFLLAETVLYPIRPVDVSVAFEFAGTLVVAIGAAILALRGTGRDNRVPEIAVGLLWAMAYGAILSAIVSASAIPLNVVDWLIYSVMPAYVPALVFLVATLGARDGTTVTAFYAVPLALLLIEASITNLSARGVDQVSVRYIPPDTERIYLAQEDLLTKQATSLRRADPDTIELFAVLGAGDPTHAVFRREVDAVAELLESAYFAENRIVKLVNSDEAHTAYPLLNRSNLKRAVSSVSDAMDDDDILLLFLTSHGRPDRLSIYFEGVIGRDLRPDDIDDALTEAGVENVIVIVSACYSGSFIDELRRPERLILTAARHDRTSFGCAPENNWTNWGRAFFEQALRQERDPRVAAEVAKRIVAELETEAGLKPSEPQVALGSSISPLIDELLKGVP